MATQMHFLPLWRNVQVLDDTGNVSSRLTVRLERKAGQPRKAHSVQTLQVVQTRLLYQLSHSTYVG